MKDFNLFQEWLFGKNVQKEMPGKGRTFRRKISRFWDIWPLPPRIEDQHAIVFVDGIYLARKACILICCDEHHVLGWYLCRYEHSGAWEALMARVATPKFVVSDGGSGFRKAMKKSLENSQTSTMYLPCILPGKTVYDDKASNSGRDGMV